MYPFHFSIPFPPKIKNPKLFGSACCIISACLWGGCGAAGQYLINELGLSSLWLTSFRVSYCGILLLLYFTIKLRSEVIGIFHNKKDSLELILFSLIGVAAVYYSYFTAVSYTNAPTATVLQYLSPILIVFYMAIRNKKLPSMKEFIAVVFALLGTYILATHGDIHSLAISPLGLIWGLISAVTLAFYTVYPRRLLTKYNTMYIYGWAVFISAIAMNFLAPFWKLPASVNTTGVILLIYTLLFGTLVSYPLFLVGVKYIGPTQSSLLSSIEPAATAVIAVLFLHTQLTIMDIIGMICITATVFILSAPSRKKTPAVEEPPAEQK